MAKNDTLYIIGAGASVATGVPAMDNFVGTMYELFAENERKEFKNVFSALSDLRKVYSNSHLDLGNIESVLAAFDMGRLVRSLGRFSNQQTAVVYHSLVEMIVKTVEETTLFDGEVPDVVVEGQYPNFLSRAIERGKRMESRCDFISLNYDIALDHSLAKHGNYSYGFGELTDEINLLKLHGSVNWYTGGSGRLQSKSVLVDDILRDQQKHIIEFLSENGPRRRVRKLRFSERTDYKEAFIVPPSYSKYFRNKQMKAVWKNAAALLANADTIVFIGYSVPQSDLMVRFLFSVGTLPNDQIKKVVCLNPDPSVEATYQRFLGQHTNSKSKWKFIPAYFDESGCSKLFDIMAGKAI